MSLRVGAVAVVLLILVVPQAFSYGESYATFPRWEERVMLQLMNRARVNPATDLAGCGANCGPDELAPTCYTPIAPLAWNFGLNQAVRFHSESMGRNAFFAHATPFVIRLDIATLYPTLCNATAACASSGAGSTQPSTRVSRFGVTYNAEIIAAGYASPRAAFFGWLHESDPGAPCASHTNPANPLQTNGHRFQILKGSGPAVGNGYANVPASPWTNYYTGDFGAAGTVVPKIPSAAHWGAPGSSSPDGRQSSSIEFWANWSDAAGPLQATVVVNGVSNVMAMSRGTANNGAWSATIGGLATGCHRYYFQFQDSALQFHRYPTYGTLGVGPEVSCADWIVPRADLNHESRSDILLRNSTTGDIAAWQMNGTTITSGAVLGTPGTNYLLKTSGDYNGDGRGDLALQNTAGDIALWMMDGNTITSGAFVGNPGPGWAPVGSGDVNGDTRWDLVLQQASTGNVAVWQMNGAVITAGAVLGSPGSQWSVAGVADMSGDGKADIVLQNTSTGQIAQWNLNGVSIAAAALIQNPGTVWVVKDMADLDGDRKAEVLMRNQTTGQIVGWRFNNFTYLGGWDLGSPGTSYEFIGAGDYNGDAHSDLLLRHTPTGNVVVWLFDGPTFIGGAAVGSPGVDYLPVAK